MFCEVFESRNLTFQASDCVSYLLLACLHEKSINSQMAVQSIRRISVSAHYVDSSGALGALHFDAWPPVTRSVFRGPCELPRAISIGLVYAPRAREWLTQLVRGDLEALV